MKAPGKKQVALILAICFTVTASAPIRYSQASFADKWITNKTSSSPSYFAGSQRGYMNGGSMSARWPQSSDSLMTISKPSIKSGCGGIDMFLGGMSFLNMDFLVAKMERILAAAPAAAFDIALKTMAPQVSGTLKDMNAMVDKLNGLQIDDCKASQKLVGVVSDTLSPFAKEGFDDALHSAKSNFMASSGMNDLYKAGNDLYDRAVKPAAAPADVAKNKTVTAATFAGCDAAIRTAFGGGSVLGNIGSTKGLDSELTDVMRGYIGDVIVTDDEAGAIRGQYIAPSDTSTFAGLIDGTATPKDSSGGAYSAADVQALPKANLTKYARDALTTIVKSIRDRAAMSDESKAFMDSVPLPIFPALRAAVQTNQDAVMIDNLTTMTAISFAYQMTLEMLNQIDAIKNQADAIKSAKTSAVAGQDPVTCNTVAFGEPIGLLDKLEATAQKKRLEAFNAMTASSTARRDVDSLIASLKQFDAIVKKEMTARFGAGVAARATVAVSTPN